MRWRDLAQDLLSIGQMLQGHRKRHFTRLTPTTNFKMPHVEETFSRILL